MILDSSGSQIAEMSNNQIDSFGKSFIQLDRDSNAVVYQTMKVNVLPKLLSFCNYPSGIRAFERFKLNDSTFSSVYYYPSGQKKMVSQLIMQERKEEDLSSYDEGTLEVWKTIEYRTLKVFDRKGILIKEE